MTDDQGSMHKFGLSRQAHYVFALRRMLQYIPWRSPMDRVAD